MKKAFQEHLESHDGRAVFVKEAVSSKNSGSFAMAMQMFRHAPAFVISPNDQAASPRDAFLSGAGNFSVALRALDGENGGESEFWMNEEDVSNPGHNLRVGFMPMDHLFESWKSEDKSDVNDSDAISSSFDDIFHMRRWAKNGEEFRGVETLMSGDGEHELIDGSMMDLEKIPAEYHGNNALALFLQVRGIGAPDSRQQLVDLVQTIWLGGADHPPMPKAMLRGTGGWIAFEPIVPIQEGMVRQSGNDVIAIN
jgi:hypothetical protein